MNFIAKNIGAMVLQELRKAASVHLAVAYFCPDDKILATLAAVPKLTIIVSEEFTINNPYSLEQLANAKVLSVPPDDANGKLHAKVLISKRRNGSYWCLLGSANVTWQGFFSNQEACIALESGEPADEAVIERMKKWFDSLATTATRTDLDQAKMVFDSRSQYRLEPRSKGATPKDAGYWALKTTAGSTGEQHWPNFLAESVIAIGWSEIGVDPSKVSDEQLRAAISNTYDGEEPNAAARIRKFVDLKIGDIVLLCRGYSSNQEKPVHIHGVARVTGEFRIHKRSRWWQFKRDAIIQALDVTLPRDVVAAALGRDSLMVTIHELDMAAFSRLKNELRKIGVQVEV